MIIEWLKFEVALESKQKFIEFDEKIWTQFLGSYPGYLGKEVWLNPFVDKEIIVLVRWNSREQWKVIPEAIVQETEAKFAAAVGKNNYRILESGEYQVRKFHQL